MIQGDWVSAREAARVMGLNLEYVRTLLRSGALEGWKTGEAGQSSWRVSRKALEDLMARTSNRKRQLAEAV
jgi:excisionase family DNA binding protein